MAHQTETTGAGSGRRDIGPRGPALAILAVAPRPGLVLQGLCPPLTAAEAAALQTAWLKHIAVELPGAAVFLFGRPSDAMPMLRYFAGPGVELREWRIVADDQSAPTRMATVASELFADGYGPVLVRSADAPEPAEAELLLCLAASQRGFVVASPDQRGSPWLIALPGPADARALIEAQRSPGPAMRVRRGPWARTLQNALDLELLLHERRQPAASPPMLAVRNLQAALQFYETTFATSLVTNDGTTATVQAARFRLRLRQAGPAFLANGLSLPCDDVQVFAAELDELGCIAAEDGLEIGLHGGSDFIATDQDGNRLTFGTPRPPR